MITESFTCYVTVRMFSLKTGVGVFINTRDLRGLRESTILDSEL